ncbi:MAG: radical SAM protein [Candidatus Helarchaeota archaeon]|nr:radical SAM protein [Candidatus Helarchaeota archaeon]
MLAWEHPPYRPPSEAYSVLIRVTRGCTWNKCAFCNMYKTMKFERRDLQEVLDDIVTAAMYYPHYTTLFIGDSNSLVLSTKDLIQILDTIYANFPKMKRVTSYARAKTIAKSKTVEELKELHKHGLSRLHIGLETGDDELLKIISKGATAADMIEGGKKVVESGISLCFYVMPGLGGKEYTKQHIIGTANVLNQVNPDFIRIRTFQVIPGTPLWEKIQKKGIIPLTPEETLQEEYELIKRLDVTSNYVSDHLLNYPVWDNGPKQLDGKLPEDKTKLLSLIENTFKEIEENPAAKAFYERHKIMREFRGATGTL